MRETLSAGLSNLSKLSNANHVPSQTRVLVTGAAGFIGSHTCVDLLAAGYQVVGIDDFSNSSPQAVDRVNQVAGVELDFVVADVCDAADLSRVFESRRVDVVVHFAARKAVGESTRIPIEYYESNITATLRVLAAMRDHGVRDLVFSSSCSVYGDAETVPIIESAPARPTNPYARSKLMCEQILADVCARYPDWRVTALRYFNPVGAHPSGLLGEDPRGVPNNVMPFLAQVAVGRLAELQIFGDDYPTADGTGVRDYIHVVDVAEGHRRALERLGDTAGYRVVNLGTGVGASVLDLVRAFATACGRELPHRVTGRRPGDVATLVADPAAARDVLGWESRYDLAAMCRHAWEFQRRNPNGYATEG